MGKKRLIAVMLGFGMLFSSSVVSVAAEAVEDYSNCEMEGEETLASYSDTYHAINAGDILSPVKSLEEQLSNLSDVQKEMVLEK